MPSRMPHFWSWAAAIALAVIPGCGGSTTSTPATPTPTPTPAASFTILNATPAAGATITLPLTPGEGLTSPIIDFQFSYPQDLTLGVGRTNFQVALLDRVSGTECMATQIAYARRLDRSDGVYLANATARVRTGFGVRRDIAQYRCGTSFTTGQVTFNLGPDLPTSAGLPATVNTGWTFAVR